MRLSHITDSAKKENYVAPFLSDAPPKKNPGMDPPLLSYV